MIKIKARYIESRILFHRAQAFGFIFGRNLYHVSQNSRDLNEMANNELHCTVVAIIAQ